MSPSEGNMVGAAGDFFYRVKFFFSALEIQGSFQLRLIYPPRRNHPSRTRICSMQIDFKRTEAMKKTWLYVLASLAMLSLPSLALASSIVVSVGNTAPTDPFNGGAPL